VAGVVGEGRGVEATESFIMNSLWTNCREQLPPENVVVETIVDDGKSARNEAPLKRRGMLWFFPDDSMYVYYKPTHWRHLSV
jgi:hypothetical protein